MIRLFVAIDLPPDVKEHLAAICYGLAGARWIDLDQLHLTLRFIGEVDGSLYLDIKEILSTVKTKPFSLQLKGVGHFPPRKEPRVIWVGVEKNEALPRLRAKIETTLVKEGLPPEGRKYSPHITIARLKNTATVKVGNFMAANSLFASEPFPVEKFYLYSSKLTPKGAIHIIEASYPLS
jgi:2'-5' RNA ligase